MDQHQSPDDRPDLRNGAENRTEDGVDAVERQARRRYRTAFLRRPLRGEAVRNVVFLGSAAVAAVLLAAVVSVVPTVRSWLPGGSSASQGDPAVAPTPEVPGGIPITSTAGPDPFARTPAAAYPKGAAGITLPPASAITGFTVEQVDAALQQVRAALIAGRLDNAMLVGHDPSTFLALLAPGQRGNVGAWFHSDAFSSVATWIDPAVQLDPAEQPRVSGRVTYTSAVVDGVRTLQVTTNFVWVYAFDGTPSSLAVAHDEVRWEFPQPDQVDRADVGMWIAHTQAYTAWIDCTAAAKGLLAPASANALPTARPRNTEDPNAYLRADHHLDITDDCATPSAPASIPPSVPPTAEPIPNTPPR